MAKCNLLQPKINTEFGTFYTFSQWSEDMTIQNALGDAYRIVPSRFACFNVEADEEKKIGLKVQDFFEHPCAAFRHFKDIDTNVNEKFSPKDASILFWNMLKDTGFVNEYASNMVYVGEMDLQGTNYIDGVTYSELYCSVPSTGKKMVDWTISPSSEEPSISFEDSSYGRPFGWTGTLPAGAESNADYPVILKGYYDGPAILNAIDNQTQYSSLNTLDSLHKKYMNEVFVNGNFFTYADDTSFEFNVIVLFYDIVAKDKNNNYNYIYTAVPMGMYVTPDMELVKKYVTNDDIYGQGSSYGLRVTTKFCAESLVPQQGLTHESKITVSVETLYPELAAVLDRFNATTEALDRYTSTMQTEIGSLTDHLSNFKDSKVNVPYIREIKGSGDSKPEKYWFVNGRSTGVKVSNVYTIEGGDTGSLESLIREVITGWPDGDIDDYIVQMILQYLNDADIGIDDLKQYIEHIEKDKYYNKPTIVKIPQTEDYQDLAGDCSNLFYNCSSLTHLPKLELHNAESLESAFYGCSSLKTIYIPDTISCKDFINAFKNCSSLENLNIDATSATDFSGAFDGCTKLKNLRITNIDPTNINSIDLSSTKIDFASLENIVMSMKSQLYETTFDNADEGPTATITLRLPLTLNINNRAVMDLVYIAQMNKNIRIIITN